MSSFAVRGTRPLPWVALGRGWWSRLCAPQTRPFSELPAELGEPFGLLEQLGDPSRSHLRYALVPATGLSLSEYLSAWEASWSPIEGRRASALYVPGRSR